MAAGDRLLDGRGRELGHGAGERDDLGAAGEKLGRAAFVHLKMCGLVAENPLIAAAQGGECERIGGGAVEDEKHLALSLEHGLHLRAGLGGPGVVAVTGGAAGIGGGEGGEGFRAQAGGVVAGKGVIGADGGHGCSGAGKRGASQGVFVFGKARGRALPVATHS
jgi:hypothetical protein